MTASKRNERASERDSCAITWFTQHFHLTMIQFPSLNLNFSFSSFVWAQKSTGSARKRWKTSKKSISEFSQQMHFSFIEERRVFECDWGWKVQLSLSLLLLNCENEGIVRERPLIWINLRERKGWVRKFWMKIEKSSKINWKL